MKLEWTLLGIFYGIVAFTVWRNQRHQKALIQTLNERMDEVMGSLGEAQQHIDQARTKIDNAIATDGPGASRLLLLARNDLDVTYTSHPGFTRARDLRSANG